MPKNYSHTNSVNLKDGENLFNFLLPVFYEPFDKNARKAMKTAQATFLKEKLIRKQF